KAKNTDFVGHEHSFLDHKTPACEFDLYDVNTSIGGRFTIQQTGGREELFERCGSLRGFARDVGGFIHISHIRIIQPEGKEAFIQMPQRSNQTNNGGGRDSNVVDLPDNLAREVEECKPPERPLARRHVWTGESHRTRGRWIISVSLWLTPLH